MKKLKMYIIIPKRKTFKNKNNKTKIFSLKTLFCNKFDLGIRK